VPARTKETKHIASQDQFDYRVNERIRTREVRLIDGEGQQLGVVAIDVALNVARQADLDLVEIAPDAVPPVCKVMDFDRFKYEMRQRAKEARKKSTNTTIKEMKYRPKIGVGDFDTKTRQVEKFLIEGHKVKVTIMFRGREMSHPELGMKILQRVAEVIAHVGKVDIPAKQDGRNMTMVLGPEKAKPAPKPSVPREMTGLATPVKSTTAVPPTPATATPAPAPTETANTTEASATPATAQPSTDTPQEV